MRGTSWFDDEELWASLRPVLFGTERIGATASEVDGLEKLVDLVSGMDVLDLCCGVGRHTVELAKRGHRVTGVDRTEAYLEEARSRAAAEGVTVELVHEDMRRFRRDEAFDRAISMFTSFGYFEKEGDDRRVLERLFASLRPGGRLLVDLKGREVLARGVTERSWVEVDGVFLLEERKGNADWSWIDNRWIILDGERRTEHSFGLRIYSAPELEALLREVGFDGVEIFGSLDGAPYDDRADRLVVVARRP